MNNKTNLIKNAYDHELKTAICISIPRFNSIIANISNNEVNAEYSLDGIWFNSDTIESAYEAEQFIIDKLSDYFGVKVTSIHMDDCETSGIWIVYKND